MSKVRWTCVANRKDNAEFAWYLPTLDSIEKQRILAKELRSDGTTSRQLWISLFRSDPKQDSEARNLDEWSDPKKWSWVSMRDGSYSVLADSYVNAKPPWAVGKGEPNNFNFNNGTFNFSDLDVRMIEMERCVVAKLTNRDDAPWLEWFDERCALPKHSEAAQQLLQEGVLVCQGTRKSTPLPTESNTTTEAAIADRSGSSEPEKESAILWHWIAIGLGAALVVISVISIAGACYVRKLRRRS